MGNMVESSDKVADETTTKKQPTALQRAAAAVHPGIAAVLVRALGVSPTHLAARLL